MRDLTCTECAKRDTRCTREVHGQGERCSFVVHGASPCLAAGNGPFKCWLCNRVWTWEISDREKRRQLAMQIPWVTHRKLAIPCDGVKWNRVASKDLYYWGPGDCNPPRGIQERAKCKMVAEWHFVGVERFMVSSGNRVLAADFCWSHLVSHLFMSMDEDERMKSWMAEWEKSGKQYTGVGEHGRYQ